MKRVKALKMFTTWDATGKVSGVTGEWMEVLDSTAERLLTMQLVAEPPKKRKKRAAKSEE